MVRSTWSVVRALGTTIRVRIPLTLAIIPALIITSGSERFAIPQAYVKELVAMRSDRTGPSIEGLDGAPVVRIRDRLLPVIFIDSWLGLRKPNTPRSKSGMVVVVHVDDYEFGLVVDGVTADEEHVGAAVETASLWIIVVKPIGSLLARWGSMLVQPSWVMEEWFSFLTCVVLHFQLMFRHASEKMKTWPLAALKWLHASDLRMLQGISSVRLMLDEESRFCWSTWNGLRITTPANFNLLLAEP